MLIKFSEFLSKTHSRTSCFIVDRSFNLLTMSSLFWAPVCQMPSNRSWFQLNYYEEGNWMFIKMKAVWCFSYSVNGLTPVGVGSTEIQMVIVFICLYLHYVNTTNINIWAWNVMMLMMPLITATCCFKCYHS